MTRQPHPREDSSERAAAPRRQMALENGTCPLGTTFAGRFRSKIADSKRGGGEIRALCQKAEITGVFAKIGVAERVGFVENVRPLSSDFYRWLPTPSASAS